MAPFRSANPVAQFSHFRARQKCRESRIRSVEQMMTFIEHVTKWSTGIIGFRADRVARCVRHHECMIGDDDIGVARAANAVFDETSAVMGAGRVNAFAAPVGQFVSPEFRRQKAGQSFAGHIAVGCCCHPS